ncbi:3-mercaptopyruvate sulfurtransferase [Acidipila sp. EB88]|uniref:3-mercaptopyruvate sulfurtransferase n=1 Tax=Acidipila sp. EB88 TaxID=2305226 RepID=UPI000F5E5514|nr:3-mercaptopyruvate sulfurtransferase [Acidipila sp. EB88]RRA48518.1 3-mercaptopyruvate sulfurtransferase [Acidipila sp. EB88]
MDPLVSPSWLFERLGSARLNILDATLAPPGSAPGIPPYEQYLSAHIPGAHFFDIDRLSDNTTPLPHMLPSAERFARDMQQLGVSEDALIVVYEQGDVFSAPRAWWMLRSLGAKRVYILDGGLPGWQQAALPVETGPVPTTAASFHAAPDPEAVSSIHRIKLVLSEEAQHRTQILDARSRARFAGTAPEPRPGIASGHMPGSLNVPYTELIRDGRMKPSTELTTLFRQWGVDLERPVITTCGSGVTAAVIALALAICGATQVSLYDGSWAEYARDPEAVIERAL